MPPGFSPRTIHLSSKYATYNYDTNMTKCSFQLSRPISIPQQYQLSVGVISACIPSTFYAIPAPVQLQYNIGAGLVNWVLIPAGNWSTADFTQATGTVPASPARLSNASVTVTYTQETGLFTFTALAPYNVTIPISPILGTTATHLIPSGTSVAGDTFPQIGGTLYINVLSSLNTDCITSGSTPGGSGVLVSIPVTCMNNSVINYLPSNIVKSVLKENSLSSLEITLCDDNLTPLNMNGVPWAMDLYIECGIPNKDHEFNQTPVVDLFSAVRSYNR